MTGYIEAKKAAIERGLVPYMPGEEHNIQPHQEGLRLPFTFAMVHGASLPSFYLHPLYARLRIKGHRVVLPLLDDSDVSKNFNDDANAVIDAIDNHENIFLVTHSRGIETAPRALKILADQGRLNRIVGVAMMNTAGPHGYKLEADDPYADTLRYTEQFRRGMRPTRNGKSYGFDSHIAKRVFGNKIENKERLQRLVDNMHRQRTSEVSETHLPDMPEGLQAFVIQGAEDKVLNLPRALHVIKKWLDRGSIVIKDGGHMLPMEQPDNMASLLIKLAVIASIVRHVSQGQESAQARH